MHRPALAVAAFLSSFLAGCADGGGAGTDEVDFDPLGLEATSTTGVIRGLVVDEAIKPVPGAAVTLAGTDLAATTDAGGLFGFEGLEARTYFVQVAKPGYRSTQQSADVVAGVAEPAITKVLLLADPSSLPYVVAHTYEGYIQCSFKVVTTVFDAAYCDPQGATGLSRNDDSMPWFAVSGQPEHYQSEMTWDSTQQLGTGLVTIQFACDEGDCGETDTNRLCNVRGHSPLVCRVNATWSNDGMESGGGGHGLVEAGFGTEAGGYSVQMFANCFECVPGTVAGVGVVLEQRFQVFNHLFYGYLPPESWLFLADGPPPPPL